MTKRRKIAFIQIISGMCVGYIVFILLANLVYAVRPTLVEEMPKILFLGMIIITAGIVHIWVTKTFSLLNKYIAG